ncbi:hypothetical protein DT076_16790 [Desertihabitans brevis]|uniref:Uncharacterized protein n=1 Tax=Desertihabitans brevis TaxID=2268447 RepID=A0A367YQY9_9ACTN|nr:hypothetical protein [Desertihabitans brevis]RCK68303.1 hypothetical protein DT076_16790 [Desertihabitans brevis]
MRTFIYAVIGVAVALLGAAFAALAVADLPLLLVTGGLSVACWLAVITLCGVLAAAERDEQEVSR